MKEPIITIPCMYSCDLCGIEKARVEVPARRESQDVKAWIEQVAAISIYADHVARSPGCRATEISKLWIPVDGARFIGDAAQN